MHARERVRWAGLPLVWALVALVLVANYWWGLYLGATGIHEVQTAGAFLASMALPMVLYLICSSALPETVPAGGLDVGEVYFRQRRFFFGLLLAYFAMVFIQAHVAADSWAWTAQDTRRAALIVMVAPLLVSRAGWYHWLAAAVVTGFIFSGCSRKCSNSVQVTGSCAGAQAGTKVRPSFQRNSLTSIP